jgi:DnaJ-class molecular chaperone
MEKVENDQSTPRAKTGVPRSDVYAKKPKQRANDEECAACRGTGVIVLLNPAVQEIKQPPVCPRCGGTGRAPYGQRQVIRAP